MKDWLIVVFYFSPFILMWATVVLLVVGHRRFWRNPTRIVGRWPHTYEYRGRDF